MSDPDSTAFRYMRRRLLFAGLLLGMLFAASQSAGWL